MLPEGIWILSCSREEPLCNDQIFILERWLQWEETCCRKLGSEVVWSSINSQIKDDGGINQSIQRPWGCIEEMEQVVKLVFRLASNSVIQTLLQVLEEKERI